jgi:hypothetical protein
MYSFVFVYKVHGKWNRQLGRFLYKMVVKHCHRILSMYSRCNYSHSTLFILCRLPARKFSVISGFVDPDCVVVGYRGLCEGAV